MLKNEIKDLIKSNYKIDIDKLIAAITDPAEVDFVLDKDVKVLTDTELTTRDENVRKNAKTEFETVGENKGKELAAKAFRKKMGLPDELGVDLDKIADAAKAKNSAGDAGLKQQNEQLLLEKESWIKEKEKLNGDRETAEFDSELISNFPSNLKPGLTNRERLMLIKGELSFEKTTDGKLVVKKGDQIIQDDKTHAPLPLDKALATVFTQRDWIEPIGDGGRGGGSNPGGAGGAGGGTGSAKTFSKFREQWIVNNPGKNDVSPEFDADLAKVIVEVKDFNMDA